MEHEFEIVLTQSRIDDGYLAIPVRFSDWLPNQITEVTVVLDGVRTRKRFTPKRSNTKEARIYDLREWFIGNGLRDGDRVGFQLESALEPAYRIDVLHRGNSGHSGELVTPPRVHICFGDPKLHFAELQKPEEERSPEVKWWNLSTAADRGERVVLYMLKPQSAFVAAGLVDRQVQPAEIDVSSPWYGPHCYWLTNVKLFDAPVRLADVQRSLPEWARLKHLQPTCIPNNRTSPPVVQRFLRLLGLSDLGNLKDSPVAIDFDPPPPGRVKATTYRVLRDTALARQVKEMHRYRCQICGETILLPGGAPYAEAHHIQPLGAEHKGLDVLGNILCLCPNHHVELDYCAILIDVERLRHVPGHVLDPRYIEYHNSRVRKANA